MEMMIIFAGMCILLILLSVQVFKTDREKKRMEQAWKTTQEEVKAAENLYQKERKIREEKEQLLQKQIVAEKERQEAFFQTAANLFLYSQIAEEKNRSSTLKPILRTMTAQSRKILFALKEEEETEKR